ncbi:MAG: hypothetical protein ACJATI_004059 [Halioglobus sp.]|jgi:hypothetical protein
MKQITSFLIIILVFSSCFPGGEEEFEGTQLSGTVLEYGTHDPIPDVLVPLFGVVSQGVFQDPILYLVDTVRTDDSGEFYLRTDDDAATFEIGNITANDYFPYSGNQSKLVFPGENEFYTPEFVMDPVGWIQIIIIDSLNIEKPFIRLGADFIPGGSITDQNFEGFFKIYANRFHRIGIKESNNQIPIYDSIYVPALDTINFNYYH